MSQDEQTKPKRRKRIHHKNAHLDDDTRQTVAKRIRTAFGEREVERAPALYADMAKEHPPTTDFSRYKRIGFPHGVNAVYMIADPCWQYTRSDYRSGMRTYECMSIDELAQMDVKSLMDKRGGYVFLWVTFPKLPQCITMFERWGFAYLGACATWIKLNKNGATPWKGMGSYTKSNAELLLVGVDREALAKDPRLGDPEWFPFALDRVLFSLRTDVHSRKPEESYDYLHRVMTAVPAVDAFTRKHRKHMYPWGDQITELPRDDPDSFTAFSKLMLMQDMHENADAFYKRERGLGVGHMSMYMYTCPHTMPPANVWIKSMCDLVKRGRKYSVVSIDPFLVGSDGKWLLSLAQIKQLPLSLLMTDDALLFVWIPGWCIQYMSEIFGAWGVEFKTVNTIWIDGKRVIDPMVTPEQFFPSDYSASATTHMYVCARGPHSSKYIYNNRVSQMVLAPSYTGRWAYEKPDAAYQAIQCITTHNLPSIALFSSRPRFGWDHWAPWTETMTPEKPPYANDQARIAHMQKQDETQRVLHHTMRHKKLFAVTRLFRDADAESRAAGKMLVLREKRHTQQTSVQKAIDMVKCDTVATVTSRIPKRNAFQALRFISLGQWVGYDTVADDAMYSVYTHATCSAAAFKSAGYEDYYPLHTIYKRDDSFLKVGAVDVAFVCVDDGGALAVLERVAQNVAPRHWVLYGRRHKDQSLLLPATIDVHRVQNPGKFVLYTDLKCEMVPPFDDIDAKSTECMTRCLQYVIAHMHL